MRAVLVYQGGLANVFEVKCFNMSPFGREARRLLQADFNSCISFVKGMGAAGCIVRTAACNQAGDITEAHWTTDLESMPFHNKLIDVSFD